MTREETQQLMMLIQACYPNYHPLDKSVTVNIWLEMLIEYPFELVKAGLKAYVATENKGFAPSPGQIISKIKSLTTPEELNGLEAWALVSRAIRNGYYGAEEEFLKLPDVVQETVGSPTNLRNWSQTDLSSVENVIQSNFLRTYQVVCDRRRNKTLLPESLRTMIEVQERPRIEYTPKEIEERRREGVPTPEELIAEVAAALGGGI